MLDRNTWNHFIVCEQMSSGLFRAVTYKLFIKYIFDIYMYVQDLALNNPQGLTGNKIWPTNILTITIKSFLTKVHGLIIISNPQTKIVFNVYYRCPIFVP